MATSLDGIGHGQMRQITGISLCGQDITVQAWLPSVSPHQQGPASLRLLAGGILIEVALQGSQAAMAADLGHLAQAQDCLVGGGESGAAEAGARHPSSAHLLRQLADSGLSPTDAEWLASLNRKGPPFFVVGHASRHASGHLGAVVSRVKRRLWAVRP